MNNKKPSYIHLVDRIDIREGKYGSYKSHVYGYKVSYNAQKRNYSKWFSANVYGSIEKAKKEGQSYLFQLIQKYPQLKWGKNSDGNTKPLIFEKKYYSTLTETQKKEKRKPKLYHYIVVEWYEYDKRASKSFRINHDNHKSMILNDANTFAVQLSYDLGWDGHIVKGKRKINV